MDQTTGLFRPQELEERFRYEAGKIERYGNGKGLEMSLLFIKLNGLQGINQDEGWVAGDRVLLGMVQALRQSLRSVDAAARVGRTSFAVLLPETGLVGVPAILKKLQNRLDEPQIYTSPGANWHFGWTVYHPGTDSDAFWGSFLSRNGVMKGWSTPGETPEFTKC